MNKTDKLSIVECPILHNNLNLFNNVMRNLLTRSGIQSALELDFEVLGELIDTEPDLYCLGIFKELPESFFKKHHFDQGLEKAILLWLEVSALKYLSIYNGSALKSTFLAVDEYYERLDRANDRMRSLLEPEVEKIEALMNIFTLGESLSKNYRAQVQECLANLEALKCLRLDFRKSALVQQLPLTKQHIVKNPGLYEWVEVMFKFWVDSLGRSIENRTDGINGRKQLLEFLSDSMERLNPSLEFHTLDNMLRRVQKNRNNIVNNQT